MEYHGSVFNREGWEVRSHIPRYTTVHGGFFTPGAFHVMISAANGLLSREEHCTITSDSRQTEFLTVFNTIKTSQMPVL